MTVLEQMLENYKTDTLENRKNAIKEIMQQIILAGFSKTDFFKYSAFYGGTALRIFYGLNRFSEDLDFTLLTPNKDFSLDKYIPTIENVVSSLGLKFEVSIKDKQVESNIKSDFVKGNTKEHFFIFYPESSLNNQVISNEKIKIKFEIDIVPPEFATTEIKYQLLPFPYQVRIYDKPSLFAGKIHAVIARSFKSRVKGRDLYDYVFFISSQTPVNLKHLEARLKQSKFLKEDEVLTLEMLIEILNRRFDNINYNEAKNDVLPFIKDIESIELWDASFFKEITKDLKVR